MVAVPWNAAPAMALILNKSQSQGASTGASTAPVANATDEQPADAEREALRIRGEGDATATQTYAHAFSRNPEFYSFYRSLQAYERSLGKDGDLLVLTPDGEFFRYFKEASPGGAKIAPTTNAPTMT